MKNSIYLIVLTCMFFGCKSKDKTTAEQNIEAGNSYVDYVPITPMEPPKEDDPAISRCIEGSDVCVYRGTSISGIDITGKHIYFGEAGNAWLDKPFNQSNDFPIITIPADEVSGSSILDKGGFDMTLNQSTETLMLCYLEGVFSSVDLYTENDAKIALPAGIALQISLGQDSYFRKCIDLPSVNKPEKYKVRFVASKTTPQTADVALVSKQSPKFLTLAAFKILIYGKLPMVLKPQNYTKRDGSEILATLAGHLTELNGAIRKGMRKISSQIDQSIIVTQETPKRLIVDVQDLIYSNTSSKIMTYVNEINIYDQLAYCNKILDPGGTGRLWNFNWTTNDGYNKTLQFIDEHYSNGNIWLANSLDGSRLDNCQVSGLKIEPEAIRVTSSQCTGAHYFCWAVDSRFFSETNHYLTLTEQNNVLIGDRANDLDEVYKKYLFEWQSQNSTWWKRDFDLQSSMN